MAENELCYALYLYVEHSIGRKTFSLFSGVNFEEGFGFSLYCFAAGALRLDPHPDPHGEKTVWTQWKI